GDAGHVLCGVAAYDQVGPVPVEGREGERSARRRGHLIRRVRERRLEHGELARVTVDDEHPRLAFPVRHDTVSVASTPAPRAMTRRMRRTNASSSTGLVT